MSRPTDPVVEVELVGLELQQQLEDFARDALEVTGAQSGSVWLIRDGRVRPVAAVGHSAKALAHAVADGYELRTPQIFEPLLMNADRLGTEEAQDTIAMDVGVPADRVYFAVRVLLDLGDHSFMLVPIAWENHLMGWIGVSTPEENAFGEDAQRYLVGIARQIAVDLENQMLLRDAQERAAELESFHQAATSIASGEELNEVLGLIADAAPRLCRATHGAVFLWDPVTRNLQGAAASRGHGRAVKSTVIPIDDEDSDIARAARELQPITCFEVKKAECTVPDGRCLACSLGMKSYVILPLRSAGEPVGVLIVSDRRARRYSEREVGLLSTLADQAAAAIRHARLRATLGESRRNLRRLSDQLTQTLEEERRGVAREIHDVVVQGLAALALEVGMTLPALRSNESERVHQHCERAFELLEETEEVVKRLTDTLRPRILDEVGLTAAVRWHCEQVSQRTGLRIRVRADDEMDVSTVQATAIFRALQEALSNVIRHAHAHSVDVELRREGDRLLLDVTDDGRGFDTSRSRTRAPGIGLLSMAERARQLRGRLDVTSAPGEGTHVRLRLAVGGSA